MFLAKTGDFKRELDTERILAYAVLSSSTYHLKQFVSSYSHIENRSPDTSASRLLYVQVCLQSGYPLQYLSLKNHFQSKEVHRSCFPHDKMLIQITCRLLLTATTYSPRCYTCNPFLFWRPFGCSVCHAIFKELIAENKSQPLFKSHFCVWIIKRDQTDDM